MTATASLLGRDTELAVFDRALEAVDTGGARGLGVWGEAGIGKSRLLDELGSRAGARGHRVLAGRAAELESDVPFALWVEALDEHLSAGVLADLAEEQLAELAVALPAVERATGVTPRATGERHRVARAVRALLECLAATQPVTLLLDDVHWADPASADVIALLLHRPPTAALLLVLAARTGRAPGIEAALHAAARHGDAEVLGIGPLPPVAADALMPGIGLTARARLYVESGGNPFYLEELVRAGSAAATPRRTSEPDVPRAVMAALAAEVAGLGANARLTVLGGAVAGDPFDPAIAAAAAGVSEATALAALDELLAADLVRPAEHARRFRFRHPLVRRAVYASAGGGWRIAAHARAADALVARTERAHHVERAAQPGDLDAVELLAAAAGETALSAPATAAGWYATAERLLPEGHEPRRLELLLAQGAALASAGHAADARDVLRRVLTMLPANAVDQRVAVAVALAQLQAVWTQEPDAARRMLEAERVALGDVPPGPAAALALAMAGERNEHGDFAAVESLARQARTEARAAGDRPLEALAAAMAADAAHCRLRGDDAEAVAAADRRIAEAGALIDGMPDEHAAARLQALLVLTIARLFTGDFPGAHASVERGLTLARRTRQGLLGPAFVSVRGFVAQELGRLDAAQADEEEALDSAQLTGNSQVAYWASIELGAIELQRGRIEAALEHGHAAWEVLGTRGYSQAGFVVADARLAAGDPSGALEALEAFDWVRPQMWTLDRVKAADVAVRVLLALDRIEDAAAWAQRVTTESGGRRTGIFGAIAARSRASVLLATGNPQAAASVAAAGTADAEAAHAPAWAGRCRTLAGEALAASGRRDEAREALRRAAADLEALGAFGLRDAALRPLRRLGERPRPATPTAPGGDGPLAPLTRRERQVAVLVASGHTNAQVAYRLQLSERTVEKHVSNLLAKLGMSTRAEVVRLLATRHHPYDT